MVNKALVGSVMTDIDVAFITVAGRRVTVDADDLPLLLGKNIGISARARTSYAYLYTRGSDGRQKNTYIHRLVLSALDGFEVDHINGDGLDNRKVNLRIVTRAQNMKNIRTPITNTSGVKGVRLKRRGLDGDRWSAEIRHDGKNISLGGFGCITAAAMAYAKASRDLHGKFGRTA